MSNITVSYQEYDRLCDLMPKLTLLPDQIPSSDEAELLVSSPHFLSMAVWLLEKEECIPENADGEVLREQLLDLLDDELSAITVKNGLEMPENIIQLSMADYENVYQIAQDMMFVPAGVLPPKREIEQIILPNIKFSLGFILALLLKNPDLSRTAAYKGLKNIALQHFVICDQKKQVELSKEKFMELQNNILNVQFDVEDWWPSMDEAKRLLAPNFSKCFDFIIWFLKNNVPITSEQKEVKKFLEKLVRDNLHIPKVQNVKWIGDL
ncbi:MULTISPECIES: hypothetical protein [unclassified Ruminococcus]|uniref:hypothetical protein n=1 Tax=unclassified Ruminococcus TaxID=2608920 RepID=UPI00189D3721|nr:MULTISPECIES: hypothetical protein [unclassified Ruminococcus]MDB8756872.1 hypothetical protein [Ruminococcus sp. 1001136sp1]MDB8760840.1 hypothetical protein [Ruminococcus sp. 1001136sp1]MDB8765009.1 hypothetical protein [Ruminococcus sp. 1001136sp1]MDB8768767.1 hypothetical protein [Ruminococcus sp. 1001136sp1]